MLVTRGIWVERNRLRLGYENFCMVCRERGFYFEGKRKLLDFI